MLGLTQCGTLCTRPFCWEMNCKSAASVLSWLFLILFYKHTKLWAQGRGRWLFHYCDRRWQLHRDDRRLARPLLRPLYKNLPVLPYVVCCEWSWFHLNLLDRHLCDIKPFTATETSAHSHFADVCAWLTEQETQYVFSSPFLKKRKKTLPTNILMNII